MCVISLPTCICTGILSTSPLLNETKILANFIRDVHLTIKVDVAAKKTLRYILITRKCISSAVNDAFPIKSVAYSSTVK